MKQFLGCWGLMMALFCLGLGLFCGVVAFIQWAAHIPVDEWVKAYALVAAVAFVATGSLAIVLRQGIADAWNSGEEVAR